MKSEVTEKNYKRIEGLKMVRFMILKIAPKSRARRVMLEYIVTSSTLLYSFSHKVRTIQKFISCEAQRKVWKTGDCVQLIEKLYHLTNFDTLLKVYLWRHISIKI